MILVVVARVQDRAARSLAERWRARGGEAGVLTCADLSLPGWRHEPAAPGAGRAVVGGTVIAEGEIRAVVTRLSEVTQGEVPWIHPQDRAYAAAEMQAFLVAWLASLRCPVVNRPTPDNLAGPPWSAEQWAQRARRLGIPVRPSVRRAAFPPPVAGTEAAESGAPAAETVAIDVVGSRCFTAGCPADDTPAGRAARTLAREAAIDLARVTFALDPDPRLAGVTHWIDVADPAVADALLDHCLGNPPVLHRVETRLALA